MSSVDVFFFHFPQLYQQLLAMQQHDHISAMQQEQQRHAQPMGSNDVIQQGPGVDHEESTSSMETECRTSEEVGPTDQVCVCVSVCARVYVCQAVILYAALIGKRSFNFAQPLVFPASGEKKLGTRARGMALMPMYCNFTNFRCSFIFGSLCLWLQNFASVKVKGKCILLNVSGQTGKYCLLTWAGGVKVADHQDRTGNLSLR